MEHRASPVRALGSSRPAPREGGSAPSAGAVYHHRGPWFPHDALAATTPHARPGAVLGFGGACGGHVCECGPILACQPRTARFRIYR